MCDIHHCENLGPTQKVAVAIAGSTTKCNTELSLCEKHFQEFRDGRILYTGTSPYRHFSNVVPATSAITPHSKFDFILQP
jgi:hypothetical protein